MMTDISRRTALKAALTTSAAFATSSSLLSQLSAVSHTMGPAPVAPRQSVLDLSGAWHFRRDDEARGLDQRWFAGKLPTGLGQQFMALPGTTDEASLGHPNPDPPSLSGLYRPNIYEGPAWYQREVEIPESWKGKSLSLFLERTHWVTHAWIDGAPLGSQESLVSPHIYGMGRAIAPGKHLLTICVDNTLIYDLGRFVSVYYEGTQTNWNGIIGRIELIAKDPVHIASMRILPDISRKLAVIEVAVANLSGHPVSGTLHFTIKGPSGELAGSTLSPFTMQQAERIISVEVPISTDLKLWDEFTPHLYSLQAALDADGRSIYADERSEQFGMRELGVRGKQFTLNGRPLMLRGTLECGIFPLTAYPPTDVDSWRRIYQIEKSYGLNYIRFHSWTPPQAAFTAADIEGILVQTEAPQANVSTGVVLARDAFVERELLRIVNTYGNHPSFALMTIGNEFGGSMEVVTRWVDLLLKADTRHLYSSASSNAMRPANRQFTEGAEMRGVRGPGSSFEYGLPMAKQDRPFIGHEIGQWTFFPNLDEARKYTGVLKAKNFEIVRDYLLHKGMLDQSRLFLQATGKQAVLLYKDEIETMLRTRDYAGFSLLDLHDYPGQGTALIGLLDPFWDSKGLIEPAVHKGYAGPVVPLLHLNKRAFEADELLQAQIDLAQFGPTDLESVEAAWTIIKENGSIVAEGTLPKAAAKTGQLTHLGTVSAKLVGCTQASKLAVVVSLKGIEVVNSWDIWVYPKRTTAPPRPSDIIILNAWGKEARSALEEGKRVLLFPRALRASSTLKGSFLPVFWSPIWFSSDPATMGILVNPDHPVFSKFPTDLYSNWQWHSLIEGSQSVILDNCPQSYRPLVQVIDNFARNYRLGNLFEAKVGPGNLMVCTLNLGQENVETQTTEQRAFLASLFDYVDSDLFIPEQELSTETLNNLLARAV